jgi:inhibitor of KinA
MNHPQLYHTFPLGDSAITVEFGNAINEQLNEKIIFLFEQLRQKPIPGLKEIVPAYHTLTFHYDIFSVKKAASSGFSAYDWIKGEIEKEMNIHINGKQTNGNHFNIPVCYENEYAPDIGQLAQHFNISVEELIRIHSARTYRVYMLGFLPGFAYLGSVNEKISASRKAQPVNVAAGSIGIAGIQTGIYPITSPGGWQIIGRTPLSMFDPNKPEPSLLKAGDSVCFYSISSHEFANY